MASGRVVEGSGGSWHCEGWSWGGSEVWIECGADMQCRACRQGHLLPGGTCMQTDGAGSSHAACGRYGLGHGASATSANGPALWLLLQMFAVARVFSRRARAMLGAARLDVFARARASFRVQQ